MNINNLLDDINIELSSLKPLSQPPKPDNSFIPTFKVEDIRLKYKQKIYDFIQKYIQDIQKKQEKYDIKYKEDLYKRKEYVLTSLNIMKKELESPETSHVKNLKSQIDFIKSQGIYKVDKIHINKENSLKIINFLYKIPLENEYDWMEDFLRRKIVFEIDTPSELEVINLRKMVNLLHINDQGSSM